MTKEKVRCIYSDEIIDPGNYALDHFIPWSYLAHDQLWNLVPCIPEVNSAKGNHLPRLENYLAGFIERQELGLSTSKKLFAKSKWENSVDCYMQDLNLSKDQLLKSEKLSSAYNIHFAPIIDLASLQGFERNWEYHFVDEGIEDDIYCPSLENLSEHRKTLL